MLAEAPQPVGQETYVAIDEPQTRFVMEGDTGKLYLGNFFANCNRIPESEEDGENQQSLLPKLEVDGSGLTLIQIGQPETRREFGHGQDGMLAFVSRFLGSPRERFTSEECPIAPDVVAFDPMTLYFRDGAWVAWSLRKDDRDQGSAVQVQTAEGMQSGGLPTFALSPNEQVQGSTLGLEFRSEDVSYVIDGEASVIRSVWAGDMCVYR